MKVFWKKFLQRTVLIFSLFYISLFSANISLNKPRIFIIHSYALDFAWVRDINQGFNMIFNKKPYYDIKYFYMDTKNHPDKEYIEKISIKARKIIEKNRPDVLIAVDDNAQKYVASHYLKIRKMKKIISDNSMDMKVIFTGVNAEPELYNYHKAMNVTGVLERLPFDAFKEILLKILPENRRRILHISDDSITSHNLYEEMEKFNWSPLKLTKSFKCKTFKEWKENIKKAKDISDVLLITHYHTIKEKKGSKNVVSPKSIIEWTELNTQLPTIGCWGFFVEDGGMLAIGVSPYEQGRIAAKFCVNIIENGTKPYKIPISTTKQFVIYIREKNIKLRGIKLPSIIEAFARATNNYIEE